MNQKCTVWKLAEIGKIPLKKISLSGSLVNCSLKLISESTQSILHRGYLKQLCIKACDVEMKLFHYITFIREENVFFTPAYKCVLSERFT